MPTLGANTQCWHLPIQLDILVGANTECWHPVLTPMNTSRYTGRCWHWVLTPTNTSRHTGRCQHNIASAKLNMRCFEVLLIKKWPWLLNPAPTRILESLCSLVHDKICCIIDMIYLYKSSSCSSAQMDDQEKLDLNKLCEFCFKGCAERRKMTAVNWVN